MNILGYFSYSASSLRPYSNKVIQSNLKCKQRISSYIEITQVFAVCYIPAIQVLERPYCFAAWNKYWF